MTEQLPDLVSRLRIDTTELDRAVGRASRMGGLIGGALGGALGAASTAGLAKIGDFVQGSVDAFAALEDAEAAATVQFGAGMAAVQRYAAQAATSAGMSERAAFDAANTFGTLGKAAGLQGQPLAKFATDLTQLAGDMASFKGTTPEEAIQAVGAALRGESEPIRRYGVLLDEAALKAEAMRLGLVKASTDQGKVAQAQLRAEVAQRRYNAAVKEHGANSSQAKAAQAGLMGAQAALKRATEGSIPPLTQQQKVLAAQSAIFRQTRDAQGDYARTADSTANTEKRLAAIRENQQAVLGRRLAPAMTLVRNVAIDLLGGLNGLIAGTEAAVRWFREHATVTTVLAAALAAAAAGVGTYLVITRTATVATKAWMAITKAMTVAQAALSAVLAANPIGLVIVALAALAAGLYVAYRRSETFRRIVNAAFTAVRAAVTVAVRTMIGVIGWFADLPGRFRAWFDGARAAAISRMVAMVAWVRGLPGRVVAALAGFGAKVAAKGREAIAGLQDGAEDRWTVLRGWVAALPRRIADALGDVGRWLVAKGRSAVAGIQAGATERWGALREWVAGIPGRIVGAVGNLGGLLYAKGQEVIQGLIDGIRSMIGNIGGAMGDALGAIRDRLPGSPVKTGPLRVLNQGRAGRQIVEMIAAGVRDARGELATALDAATRLPRPDLAVAAPAVAGYASPPPATAAPAVNVRVFIGERELTDLVDLRVETSVAGVVGAARRRGARP